MEFLRVEFVAPGAWPRQGDKVLVEAGVDPEVLGRLDLMGISGVGNKRLCGEEKPSAAAAGVYVNAVFDTIEKALSSRKMAKKGAETGLLWSIADFGSPVLLYGIVGVAI